MASDVSWPTAYPDVNAVLGDLGTALQGILGSRFIGMYVYGSLALGDFDPAGSDIDFLVATDGELSPEQFVALSELHRRFDASGSPWAARVEAAYIPAAILQGRNAGGAKYPQVEKGEPVVLLPLEDGWPFQCHSLREHGVTVVGPDPHELVAPVSYRAMREAAAVIVSDWLALSQRDPEWLAWLEDRTGQAFVVLTLCRLLYTLDTGDVASKPQAAQAVALGPAGRWSALIERSLTLQRRHVETPAEDVEATLALLRFTAARLGMMSRALAPEDTEITEI